MTNRNTNPLKGQCYPLCEILYQLLGGKEAGWKPMVVHIRNETHWYLEHVSGAICDPTADQYPTIDYLDGKGCGFLTKTLSKRARKIVETARLH